jgi:hypothetical protein
LPPSGFREIPEFRAGILSRLPEGERGDLEENLFTAGREIRRRSPFATCGAADNRASAAVDAPVPSPRSRLEGSVHDSKAGIDRFD